MQTEYDWAPLHWAASYGHVDCVKLLIEAGANVSVVSDQGVTPLDLAFQSDQVAIVEILKRAGAKNAKDVSETASESPLASLTESERDWIYVDQSSETSAPMEDTTLGSKLFLVFDKPLSIPCCGLGF